MKFGKHCEMAYPALSLGEVPPFPYKRMKKRIKTVQCEENGGSSFVSDLNSEVRRIDAVWSQAARRTIEAARAPRKDAFARAVGLRSPPGDARKLAAWAQLSRDGVRKILKKANKQLTFPSGPIDMLPGEPLAFVCSRTRTELECLAEELESQDCPVCLGILYDPVAPACGHAVCRDCFQSLRERAAAPQCPICRRSVDAGARALPIVGAAVKAANPADYAARKKEKEAEQNEALAKRYAHRINQHPMMMVASR